MSLAAKGRMNREYVVHIPVSPATDFKLVKVGVMSRVVLPDANGVLAMYIRDLSEKPDAVGLLVLAMPVSGRILKVNPASVVSVEPVALWRATCRHGNENFPSPLVEHFLTHPSAVIKTSMKHDYANNADNLFGVLVGENF